MEAAESLPGGGLAAAPRPQRRWRLDALVALLAGPGLPLVYVTAFAEWYHFILACSVLAAATVSASCMGSALEMAVVCAV